MDSISSAPTGELPAVQALPPKRKRGRPRKMPKVAMDMVAQSVLSDLRGALGMEQPPAGPPVVDIVPEVEQEEQEQTPTTPSPVKRGRGRPRKHPLPTDGDIPPVKRGRGRPKKVLITTTEAEPSAIESTDSVSAMIVAPPEVMPESGQVSITHVPTSSTPAITLEQTYSHASIPLVAITVQPDLEAPLPLVSGNDLPQDKPGKKRGRPRKNPLPTDAVSKKKPQIENVIEVIKNIQGNPVVPQMENVVEMVQKVEDDPIVTPAPVVKRGPGRPRKTSLPVQKEPLPSVQGQEQPSKKKRGRPRKNPLPTDATQDSPVTTPKKQPQPDGTNEPVVKRKPGRPKKNPVSKDSTAPPPVASHLSTPQQNPTEKRKRGRPKKNTTTSVTAAMIPAQSSEPINPSFPADALVSPYSEKSVGTAVNVSSDASRSGTDGFQLILSSSDSEPAESDDVANAIATLEDIPRKASPLLDERFIESSDEDD